MSDMERALRAMLKAAGRLYGLTATKVTPDDSGNVTLTLRYRPPTPRANRTGAPQ